MGFIGGRALYAQSHKPKTRVTNTRIPTTRNLGITPGSKKRRIPKPLPERSGTSAAETVLGNFLAHINNANYPKAYALLSPGWRRELSAKKFESGFSKSTDFKYRVIDSVELGKDRVQIDVALKVVENGKPKKYDGTYILIRRGDGWMELCGMGMVHPEVLRAGGIDPSGDDVARREDDLLIPARLQLL